VAKQGIEESVGEEGGLRRGVDNGGSRKNRWVESLHAAHDRGVEVFGRRRKMKKKQVQAFTPWELGF